MKRVLSSLAAPFVWYWKQLSMLPRWMIVILIVFYSVELGWVICRT
jgi:hypothetical protein